MTTVGDAIPDLTDLDAYKKFDEMLKKCLALSGDEVLSGPINLLKGMSDQWDEMANDFLDNTFPEFEVSISMKSIVLFPC